jgi:hypothetical protein
MRSQDRDDDQLLAVTIAALLLVGGTLLLRETAGLWVAAGVGLGGIAAAYCGPLVVRRLVAAVAVRRFGRRIAAYERAVR